MPQTQRMPVIALVVALLLAGCHRTRTDPGPTAASAGDAPGRCVDPIAVSGNVPVRIDPSLDMTGAKTFATHREDMPYFPDPDLAWGPQYSFSEGQELIVRHPGRTVRFWIEQQACTLTTEVLESEDFSPPLCPRPDSWSELAGEVTLREWVISPVQPLDIEYRLSGIVDGCMREVSGKVSV